MPFFAKVCITKYIKLLIHEILGLFQVGNLFIKFETLFLVFVICFLTSAGERNIKLSPVSNSQKFIRKISRIFDLEKLYLAKVNPITVAE